MKIIKMHKKFMYLNIIKIALNKMQIILERFCMKIAPDTTLQLLGVKKCILYKLRLNTSRKFFKIIFRLLILFFII